jgi:branched-chain amino acid transport system permease protein
MGATLSLWLGQTVNGLVLGNIYALLAAGLALIFGVAGLVNFAHGSVYMVGSYAGWVATALLGWPVWAALPAAAAIGALLGLVIERFAVRPFRNSPHVAPLLATIAAGLILDSLTEIVFSPNPKSFPSVLPKFRLSVGIVSLGFMDLLILGICIACAGGLFALLKFTRLGRSLRAAAQDSEAARQMGVRVARVSAAAFALASGLGALAGVLIGLYYNFISPSAGFQAGLKGFTACVLGGLGSVPGAMAGGILLGLGESYGVAIFGSSARSLIAYAFLLAALFLRPNGIFGGRAGPRRDALAGSFLPQSRPIRIRPALAALLVIAALALPLVTKNGYVIQVLASGWIYALFALSITFVGGTAGIMSLGQAGLMALGAYASGLLTLKAHLPFAASFLSAGFIAAAIGSLLAFPALRLRGHYIAIATLGIGEIVNQVILNWDGLTGGALGLVGIPAPRLFGLDLGSVGGFYYLSLGVLVIGVSAAAAIGASPLGRSLRALREDEQAARSLGVGARGYKALAFAIGAFLAGLAGALTAHLYTYVSHETFGSSVSILGLTMAIFGGLGNFWGAVLGATILNALPELLRFAAGYRALAYGLILLGTLRFRPQGLLGGE